MPVFQGHIHNLARYVKGSQKGFYKHKKSKRKTMENVSRLLNAAGGLVTHNTDKAKVLKAFLTSDFTGRTGSQKSQVPKSRGEACSREGKLLLGGGEPS